MTSYKKEVVNLAKYLKKANYISEAEDTLSSLSDRMSKDLNLWYDLYTEVTTSEPSPILDNITNILKKAKYYLDQAQAGLSGASKEDLKYLIENVPLDKIKTAFIKNQNFKKLGSESYLEKEIAEILYKENLIERPNYKKASWWTDLLKGSGRMAVKVLPFVALIMAMYNLYYCQLAFQRLVSELPEVGLSWENALDTKNFSRKISENKENPVNLTKLARVCKNTELFINQFVSFVANGIDGLKDIIFFILNFTSPIMAVIDISISFGILIIENSVQNKTNSPYKNIIENIKNIAIFNIKKIQNLEMEKIIKDEETEDGLRSTITNTVNSNQYTPMPEFSPTSNSKLSQYLENSAKQ